MYTDNISCGIEESASQNGKSHLRGYSVAQRAVEHRSGRQGNTAEARDEIRAIRAFVRLSGVPPLARRKSTRSVNEG